LLLQPTWKVRWQFRRCGTVIIKGDDRVEAEAPSWTDVKNGDWLEYESLIASANKMNASN